MEKRKKETLAVKLKNGEKSALEAIYWEYYGQLYSVAIRYLKDPHLAEDSVHDVMIKLWNGRKSLNENKNIEGYIFVMLKNHILNKIESESRRILRQIDYADNFSAEGTKTQELVFHNNLKEILEQGLDKLPEKKKQIFILKKLEGYSNSEVADQMGISVYTVKSQFNKANNFLRLYIKQKLEFTGKLLKNNKTT